MAGQFVFPLSLGKGATHASGKSGLLDQASDLPISEAGGPASFPAPVTRRKRGLWLILGGLSHVLNAKTGAVRPEDLRRISTLRSRLYRGGAW
jgi:hypothetical protein